jgi:EAL domain-containing protein (putative c-di-GMP-specific phosphodiesterase class I)
MNRALFGDRTSHAIGQAQRDGESLAILVIRADPALAGNVRACLRAGDSIAWLGGERIVVLLPRLKCAAEMLLYPLRRVLASAGGASISIGIALYPQDGGDYGSLLRSADAALSEAAQSGPGGFRFRNAPADRAARERADIEEKLRRALERNELELHYQAKLSIAQNRIDGAEALLRWRTADRQLISPDRFIPIAEQTGLIEPLGLWALEAACRQVRNWAQAGVSAPVAVNVSPRQFGTESALRNMEAALGKSGVEPRTLQIEITETSVAQNEPVVVRALQRMHALGLGLSMDDFGAGYSRLIYLKWLPIEELKIDRSLISDIDSNAKSRAMVTAILSLGRTLGMKLVAEGVETQAQYDCLRELGCDDVQGYYFSRPLPAGEFEQLLIRSERQRSRSA